MNAQSQSIAFSSLLAAMLITLVGAGCAAMDSNRDRDEINGSSTIPREARKVADGNGQLSYTCQSDGRVYLYDMTNRLVVDNRTLRRGERYSVNPDRNRIDVNGKRVSDRDLKSEHNHHIYFLPSNPDDRETLETESLPSKARSVASGPGEITYRAHGRGRVYIYDEVDKRVLMSRDVYEGQTIQVDPERDRVLIDGKKVYDRNLERKHGHHIYFEKD